MKEQDWDIKARSEACSKCEHEYEDQEPFYSKLTFEEDGYHRSDFCEKCWTDEVQASALSRWRTIYRSPAPPPEPAVKKETAESLLRELIETDRMEQANTIYILAVILERKRILVERDVQEREDGALIRVYEHKKTNEVFMIPDPRLKLAELETVQAEVIAMLDGTSRAAQQELSAPVGGDPAPEAAPENSPPEAPPAS